MRYGPSCDFLDDLLCILKWTVVSVIFGPSDVFGLSDPKNLQVLAVLLCILYMAAEILIS